MNDLKSKIHYTTGYAIFVACLFAFTWLLRGTLPIFHFVFIAVLIFVYFITE